eukprot:2435686-Rhodomonas_salina.4
MEGPSGQCGRNLPVNVAEKAKEVWDAPFKLDLPMCLSATAPQSSSGVNLDNTDSIAMEKQSRSPGSGR